MKEVKYLLKKIELTRKEILHENSLVENARFRLMQSPDDEMWTKIKKEHDEKLHLASDTFNTLYQTLLSLKDYLEPSDWKTVLENLGYTLAETENVEHVKYSLSNEYDLNKALKETENAIKFLKERIAVSEGDIKIIYKAQLEYYISDMKCHYWGIERLKTILDSESPKR